MMQSVQQLRNGAIKLFSHVSGRGCVARVPNVSSGCCRFLSGNMPIVDRFGRVVYPMQDIVHDELILRDKVENKALQARVNEEIVNRSHGRLFASIQIFGFQYKITTEDVIVLEKEFVPRLGERIVLSKVLMVAGRNFSLVGRPILSRDLVRVEATVIEKTRSKTRLNFHFIKRENHRHKRFYSFPQTILRINYIEILSGVNGEKIIDRASD